MANIHQDNDNVYIDLWDKTLTFNSIEYALYQLNSAFELRISKDTDAILNYRLNGVPYKVSTVNGRETNDICPYSWESLEYVRETINEAGICANEILSRYGISLTPNWREINKKWLAEVDRLEKIFGDALGNAVQAALNNQAHKYQQAYSEELSKDFGLSFGILSSSWTAHLLYAAQSAAKERKDHARAERVAADAMKNSHVDITAQIFATVYPIYVDSLEPAMQKLLSEYYAYVIAIFSKELHCSYDDVAATFDFKRSNGFILGISADAKANILQALQAFPNNGNVIGYAIKNGVLDDELCEYGKNAPENFGIILKKWAISVLSEIYIAGKLFNKPLVTDENSAIIEGLIKYYDYIEDDALGADDWQEILSVVYGDELTDAGDLFEIFDDLKESNANITKYAQANKKLVVSDEMIKKFITACEMKDGSCSWYAINMGIDTDQPITVPQVRECIIAVNAKIDAEVAILKKKAEQRRAEEEQRKAEEEQRKEAERQAEIERQELLKKKVKKVVTIVTPIVSALIIAIILLYSVIIPNGNYNLAIELMNDGKYENAISIFESLNGYKDSEDKILECKEQIFISNFGEEVFNRFGLVETGAYIKFGTYEQDNNVQNGKEKIEWLVLEVEDGEALLISRYALDCKPYSVDSSNSTWDNSTLRQWLNNSFLNTAFTTLEQATISTTTVSADKNPIYYGLNPGNTTQDKVFLLSMIEAEKYFSSDSSRQCKATKYAEVSGVTLEGANNYCNWWLRTTGFSQWLTSCVYAEGIIDERGLMIDSTYIAVRPVIRIKISDFNNKK